MSGRFLIAPEILRSEPDLTGSLQPLRERLAETVAWGSRRLPEGPINQALRTPALAPPPVSSWAETMRAVAEQRHAQLGRSWRRSRDPLGEGLLLVYFPTPPHSRGAARQASEGYFDERDAPPWDTWVAYIEETSRSYLVAWVPPLAFAQAAAGVGVAPRSLAWLDGAGVSLAALKL